MTTRLALRPRTSGSRRLNARAHPRGNGMGSGLPHGAVAMMVVAADIAGDANPQDG